MKSNSVVGERGINLWGFLENDSNYLVNHTTTGICILNVSGQVISVNCVFEELFGLRSMEVLGKREPSTTCPCWIKISVE